MQGAGSVIRSPVVLIMFISTWISGNDFSMVSFTWLACHRASMLPRVPIQIFVFMFTRSLGCCCYCCKSCSLLRNSRYRQNCRLIWLSESGRRGPWIWTQTRILTSFVPGHRCCMPGRWVYHCPSPGFQSFFRRRCSYIHKSAYFRPFLLVYN